MQMLVCFQRQQGSGDFMDRARIRSYGIGWRSAIVTQTLKDCCQSPVFSGAFGNTVSVYTMGDLKQRYLNMEIKRTFPGWQKRSLQPRRLSSASKLRIFACRTDRMLTVIFYIHDQSEFLQRTSHELKTPLHGIRNLAKHVLHKETEIRKDARRHLGEPELTCNIATFGLSFTVQLHDPAPPASLKGVGGVCYKRPPEGSFFCISSPTPDTIFLKILQLSVL
ncbi:hypothetical protein [Cohnella massiliensis]|uniref:hypothetical protein n=1 Tax=Cohnella massiliensis TaxID=1816691 RepID=UPI00111BCB81|nr:hypothetical protein [Cohnella massiliensis]